MGQYSLGHHFPLLISSHSVVLELHRAPGVDGWETDVDTPWRASMMLSEDTILDLVGLMKWAYQKADYVDDLKGSDRLGFLHLYSLYRRSRGGEGWRA